MTKFKITLIVLLSFLTLSVNAHRKMRRSTYDGMMRTGFHMGVQGSVNSTWILNQNNYNTLNLFSIPIVRQSEMDYVFTWGGHVGVEFAYSFHKHWGVEFHPSVSWAGQTYDDNFTGPVAAIQNASGNYVPDPNVQNVSNYYSASYRYVNVRREVKFNYVQFPLFLKFQTTIGEIANYYAMIGPQLNYREHASENIWVNYHLYNFPNELSVDQKFQKLDIGLALNTGVDIYANSWLYFNIGLSTFVAMNDLNGDALKHIDWYSKNDVTYQSSRSFYLGLNAGVHFYMGRKNYY